MVTDFLAGKKIKDRSEGKNQSINLLSKVPLIKKQKF